MAYIIGKSSSLAGVHEVTDQLTVKEERFKKELAATIKAVYPDDSPEHKKLVEIISKSAQDGLSKYRSVHIGGKYFFCSRRNNYETQKHLKE